MPSYNATHYEVTTYYVNTGRSRTTRHRFTEENAEEIGARLNSDGSLYRMDAERLCERWTQRGQHRSIRYTYRVI